MGLGSCWLCSNELTLTREHIIPRSMGGKKTVVGFICTDCNSRTGRDWDAAVHQFQSWQFHLDPTLSVNPQQGNRIRVRMADTGLNAFLEPVGQVRLGNNPPVKTQDEAGLETWQFTADPGRVDELFDSVNTFLQRKGKTPMTRADFDSAVTHNVISRPSVRLQLKLEIPKYFRSLVKTCMAMAFSMGVRPMDCEKAVLYLRDEAMDEEGVVTMPGTSLEGAIDDWSNYHAVTIFSFPRSRQLIGEVVYFGSVAGLVCLSASYGGPKITAGHAINLRTREYVDTDLNLPDLHLPAYSVKELLEARVGQFKSPMLLEATAASGLGALTRDLN